jgi:hypothetical protein
MKKIIQNIQIFAVALTMILPISAFASEYGDWYDSGSYYDSSWSDSGSYYSDSWYDSGSYYDDSWYDSGSYYSDSWYDSGSYYDDSWYDSGSYYDDSWYDSGSYYDDSWYDSGSYYDDSWYDSGSYYDDSYYDDSESYYYDDYDTYDTYDTYYSYSNSSNCGSNCYSYNDYDYCDTHNCTTYEDLDVTCKVSDTSIEEGDTVTYTANADGGRGSYTYDWSGDVSGSARNITRRYNNSGTYSASVRVTDRDGRTATARCSSVRVEDEYEEDFDVTCKVSDTSIEEGDTVRFTAEVDGGDSPFDYEWSGDVDSDDRTFTKRFNSSGRYEVELKVRDDRGRVARDTCSVIKVDDEEDEDRDINVSGTLSSSDGTYSGVSSVYLNQVPYTGPEDIAKGIAFVVGILVWSIIAALIIRNRMDKKAISNKIAAFKEANKAARI